MLLLSVFINADEIDKYDFLVDQNWIDTQLILYGSKENSDKIVDSLSSNVTLENILSLESVSHVKNMNNLCVSKCIGEFIISIAYNESWGPDFISQIKDLILNNDETNTVVYGVGFCRHKNGLSQAPDNYRFIRKKFCINNILSYPYYFIPSIKFVWRRSIIKEYGVMFDESLSSQVSKIAVFNLDYLTTIYQNNGYSEPEYKHKLLSFSHPFSSKIREDFIGDYQDRVRSKASIFKKNPWSKLFWQYKIIEMKKTNGVSISE